jgi:uncharacterized protein YfaS (alpha-2-macroglobulin family)
MRNVVSTVMLSLMVTVAAQPSWAQDEQASPAKTLEIQRITPSGDDVPASRQIVLEFNRAVVPVGRMDRTADEIGITVSPELNCQWRWLNTTSLSCNLDDRDSMPPATRYTMTISPKIAAEDGAMIAQTITHSFSTERPTSTYQNFSTWNGPGSPIVRVVFNQPVSQESAAVHLYFTAKNDPKRYSAKVTPDLESQPLPDYVLMPGQKVWVETAGGARPSDDQKMMTGDKKEARRVWLVEPEQELPYASGAALKIEPGLVSALGPEPGADNRDLVTFDTFPAFAYAGVRCMNNAGNEVLVTPDMSAQDETTLCNPMRPISLAFTAPVLRSEVKDNLKLLPDLAGGNKDLKPWGEENRDWSSLGSPYKQGDFYYVGLPVGLKAATTYEVSLPGGRMSFFDWVRKLFGKPAVTAFEDEFGRTLSQKIDVKFATNHRNPNFELLHHDAVLEKGVDSDIPLFVNNLDSYSFKYRRVSKDGVKQDATFNKEVTHIPDIQYAVPAGVRDMLNGKSGALYGNLETAPLAPNKYPGDYRLFAQVTPFQAHMKLGHFSSLLFVTDLATGKPVEGVAIKIYKDAYSTLSDPKAVLATATTDTNGVARLPGTDTLDPNQELMRVWEDDIPRLFARLDKGDDMALLPLDGTYSLYTWDFADNLYATNLDKFGHMKSWGMTAQGIYRAGDTMQYKIFLRHQDDRTLTSPPKGDYTLEIIDPTGKTVDEIENIAFSDFGAYAGEYKIPEGAAVGWYDFKLKANFTGVKEAKETEDVSDDESDGQYEEEQNGAGKFTLHPMRVLVSDFTPAPFKVTTELEGDMFRPDDTLKIQSLAALHSGGTYGDAAVRATVTLRKGYFSSDNPTATGFTFGASTGPDSEQLFQKEAVLNDKGEWDIDYKLQQQPIYYGKLEVETAVQDDRGKSVASLANADYFGVDRFVGLKSPQWFYDAKKPIDLKTLVVDEKGAPATGSKIKVDLEFEEINVAKVKGAGNAYLSDITREWKNVATCEKDSQLEPQTCSFTPDKAGSYRAIARIKDSKGRGHETEIGLWVSGDDYVQWNDQDNLALQVIPEKKDYKVGDVAKFLVKNPYPGATALITVERYGVIDSFVKVLNGSAPIVEIPVTGDYLPGFYLSVLVTSPRVDAPPPKVGQVDMGKPAFRMGYVTVPVKDPYKEVTVDVKAAQDVYRPRDTVDVTLLAKPRNAPDPAQPMELAVAVLDESVFDLIADGDAAFDPYRGFYSLEGLDMRNYSLLYRLIGRQKFEKKGANPGGDGGAGIDMRTLFKYVSYWNPSVPVDKDGKAQISFEAPDNLTGWRVLAVATTPTDRMGLGQGEFKVNRPTELRPVMPNQVHEGDNFKAGFSVMNRTDKKRTIKVHLLATGALKKSASTEQDVTLEPYKRTTVYLPLDAAMLPVNDNAVQSEIAFTATAQDAVDSDGMEYKMPVLKTRVIDTAATYGTTTEDSVSERIAFPTDIHTDSGNVSVTLSPSVIADLTGAFRYIRDYPYPCWEQVLTRGVMAAHFTELKPYIPANFTWDKAADLPKELLASAANYQAPNGGMAYFIPKDNYADPYLSAYTAIAFNWLASDGYAVPQDVRAKLHDYLLNFLREDAAPDFYQDGMTSTVRAVALAALAENGLVTAQDVKRYQPHLKQMSLFGKAHFMQAALRFPQTADAAKEAADMIFAAGNETGGKFMFSEVLDDGYDRMLATPLRDNCAVLSAFIDYKEHGGEQLIGDKPYKLVRMITQSRGKRDHWENTQENMFCMNGLIDYARAYESVAPDMRVTASLDNAGMGEAAFEDVRDEAVTLSRNITPDDPGKTKTMTINRDGDGRLYYATRLSYASKAIGNDSVNAGMDVKREYSVRRDGNWVLLKADEKVKRGDNVRVDLYVSLPAPRNFVVVNDPLPGGLETVNRDLATASTVDDSEAQYDKDGGSIYFKFGDWNEYQASFWSFYHKELRHDSARFYADWLPAGNYHLSYMTQAIADGSFAAPPVKAEEMYDPDVYGRGENGTLVVEGQ